MRSFPALANQDRSSSSDRRGPTASPRRTNSFNVNVLSQVAFGRLELGHMVIYQLRVLVVCRSEGIWAM